MSRFGCSQLSSAAPEWALAAARPASTRYPREFIHPPSLGGGRAGVCGWGVSAPLPAAPARCALGFGFQVHHVFFAAALPVFVATGWRSLADCAAGEAARRSEPMVDPIRR